MHVPVLNSDDGNIKRSTTPIEDDTVDRLRCRQQVASRLHKERIECRKWLVNKCFDEYPSVFSGLTKVATCATVHIDRNRYDCFSHIDLMNFQRLLLQIAEYVGRYIHSAFI